MSAVPTLSETEAPMKHLLTTALMALAAAPASAQVTIEVPADLPTIQAAIDAADAGDTVAVAPGTYAEAIDFKGKAITVVGASAQTTMIDASGISSSVVLFHTGEGPDSVLRGFRLTGGTGHPTIGHGSASGGGILCVGSAPTLEDLVVSQNSAIHGGGLYMFGGASPTVLDCTFEGNTAVDGGGVYARSDCAPTLRDCTIRGNHATGWGGGINLNASSDAQVERCLIVGNSADDKGGASTMQFDCNPSFRFCTIANNSAGHSIGGGALFLYGGPDSPPKPNFPEIADSIVWGNTPTEFFVWDSGSGNVTVSYSDVTVSTPGIGNISTDPLFANPGAGDYSLTPQSPCIDAADPQSPLDPDGTVADMGAIPYFTDVPETWVDLGPGLNGTYGEPSLDGEGVLAAGDPIALVLSNALENAAYTLVVGVDTIDAPFKGGVLVPAPDITLSFPPVFPGSFTFGTNWPVGVPSGTSLFFQYWITDPAGPKGFSASNGLRGTTP